jgi:hypothetical protein
MDDILNFYLGRNAEIESMAPDGRYLLRYTKVNGNINMIAWCENGPNENLESDIKGQKVILKLQNELNRRKLLAGLNK